MLVLLLLSSLGWAEDDMDFLDAPPQPKDDIGSFEEDAEEFTFDAAAFDKSLAAPPLRMRASGQPLTAVEPLVVIATLPGAVIVELPVLLADRPAKLDRPIALTLTISEGTRQAAQVTQQIAPHALAKEGPTWTFFKVLVPVDQTEGELQGIVRAGNDELFTVKTRYRAP